MHRQTREMERLKHFRMLQPGEVDHEVDLSQLTRPVLPIWDSPTRTACASLYNHYIRAQSGGVIPDHLFCDLPRWIFLEYLVRFCDVLLVGSNSPDLTQLQPIVLAHNVHGENVPRFYAYENSMVALYQAVLDRQRLAELDCLAKSRMSWRFEDSHGQPEWGSYFGIDYRALPHAPWRSGTVYLYDRAAFPPDFETVPFLTQNPILPMAKVNVQPRDWPMLDRVNGVNIVAQTERQRETFRGYPWTNDTEIHPNQWQRPIVSQTRSYLDTHYADPVDLRQLGQKVGLSPFALLRTFRAHVGLSPREYQTQLRITQAKRILQSGLSIGHVAAETGFCDQTHLTRHFRQIVGVTPGHYLRMQESPILPR